MEIIESEKTKNEAEVASSSGSTGNNLRLKNHQWPPCRIPLQKMLLVASLAFGIHLGWAIRVSLFTAYGNLLDFNQNIHLIIWLCGPFSGMILQPIVGHYSDHSNSRFGRRRPFIGVGVGLIVFVEILVQFAVDHGYLSTKKVPNSQTAPNFGYLMVGVIILYVGNNMFLVACRALLGDMAVGDHTKAHLVYASFSFFSVIGDIVGYTLLKSHMIISIFLLVALTSLVLFFIDEKTYLPFVQLERDSQVTRVRPPFLVAFKGLLTQPMRILLSVTCLNWVVLSQFLSYDAVWMEKEIYGDAIEKPWYNQGFMLTSVVMGVTSLAIQPLGRWVGGAKRLWGITNLSFAICMAMAMAMYVSKMESHEQYPVLDDGLTKTYALAFFYLLQIPSTISYIIPYGLASIYSVSSVAGQGLSLGVINLAIEIPHLYVSETSGAVMAIASIILFVVSTFMKHPPAS